MEPKDLREWLAAVGVTKATLARRVGYSERYVVMMCADGATITEAAAARLGRALRELRDERMAALQSVA